MSTSDAAAETELRVVGDEATLQTRTTRASRSTTASLTEPQRAETGDGCCQFLLHTGVADSGGPRGLRELGIQSMAVYKM
ncbi:hypothetical protein INR49_021163 [Caranx melampygus]|nr:hypothetical protein INR49_021163 [Caranx melampygus]